MHFVGADLEFDDLFFWGNNSSVDRLVAILFRGSDVIFEAAVHWGEEGVDDAEGEVAGGDVVDDEAEGDEVVDTVDILIVLGEFFVKRVDGFDAAVIVERDMFLAEAVFDGEFGELQSFVGGLQTGLSEIFEIFVAFVVDVAEANIFEFGADAAHLESVGERGEDFE